MDHGKVVSEQPKQPLDKAIEAACAQAQLSEGVSAEELRFHFEFIVEKIKLAEKFDNLNNVSPKKKRIVKYQLKRWLEVKKRALELHRLTARTPRCAFDEMDECDPTLRIPYFEMVDNLNEIVNGLGLAHLPGKGRTGRPGNQDLEAAVAHLVLIYERYFGQSAWADKSIPEKAPFFRFCQAIFRAADASDLTSSLAWMVEKVCSRVYRSRTIPIAG